MIQSITKYMCELDAVCILARAAGYTDIDLEPMDNGRWVMRFGKDNGDKKIMSGRLEKLMAEAQEYLEGCIDV